MRPETRVLRWREIARITQEQFAGDLTQILQMPFIQAAKVLKQFPTIGDPAAGKILLYCGLASGLPLESNGLRVLTRVGFGRQQKSYGATYQSVQQAIGGQLPRSPGELAQAHLLLREHDKTICRLSSPDCGSCPAAGVCAYARKTHPPA